MLDKNIKCLSFYLKANTANVSPPLSSVLGNLGLNTMNFCKEFNTLTESLSSFLILKVYLKVNLNKRSWLIRIGCVPITKMFRFISFKKTLQFSGLGGFFTKDYSYVRLKDFFLVLLFYFSEINSFEVRNKLSILKSMDMFIEFNVKSYKNVS